MDVSLLKVFFFSSLTVGRFTEEQSTQRDSTDERSIHNLNGTRIVSKRRQERAKEGGTLTVLRLGYRQSKHDFPFSHPFCQQRRHHLRWPALHTILLLAASLSLRWTNGVKKTARSNGNFLFNRKRRCAPPPEFEIVCVCLPGGHTHTQKGEERNGNSGRDVSRPTRVKRKLGEIESRTGEKESNQVKSTDM